MKFTRKLWGNLASIDLPLKKYYSFRLSAYIFEKSIYIFSDLRNGFIKDIVNDLFLKPFTQTFYKIQIWTVGWQKHQLQAVFILLQKWLKQPCMVDKCIVQNNKSFAVCVS